ncbi:unnamed protein product [Effrenium voratum]|uniref:Amine oxidase domain-containing protein n=1 Tax=Effrenium voratum TaxID=2562239 RepID=A0AA36INV4_9DINO|nr:unnamed protein product [Effrenium voratum]
MAVVFLVWASLAPLALGARVAVSGFASESRGPKPGHRIAIVGAGPAGVHMASRLRQMGHTETTLLERSDRVGGKSLTIYLNEHGEECEQQMDASGKVDTASCVAHEMGTCFLHNGYHSIRELVDEYNLTHVVPPEGRAMFSHFSTDRFHSQDMDEFVTSSIMDGVRSGTIYAPSWAIGSKLKVMVALLRAVKKYNTLHKEIFGEVEFSMPHRLSRETLQRINMTFLEFLQSNDLYALSGFLMFAHAAQGYGYVTTIPAFYGLWWITPELLNGYMQMSFREELEKFYDPKSEFFQQIRGTWVRAVVTAIVGGAADVVKRTTTMLPEGYQKIWTTIAEKDGLDVRYGVEILDQGIDRQLDDPSAPVRIKYRQKGKNEVIEEEYDFLIYSAPHAHAKNFVKDVAIQEESIFSSLKSFVLATTLYSSEPVLDYTDSARRPIMYEADKMSGPSHDGSWYADRWDDLIFGQPIPGRQTRVGYQFYENYCQGGDMMCNSDRTPNEGGAMESSERALRQFRGELERQNVSGVNTLRQYPWPYFHHFPQEAVQEGKVWDLLEMQGQRKTWWIGASACFESVHDVTNYNLMILRKYMGAKIIQGIAMG